MTRKEIIERLEAIFRLIPKTKDCNELTFEESTLISALNSVLFATIETLKPF